MAGLMTLLDGQQFETVEQADAFLQQALKEGRAEDLIPPPATDLERAQERMYDAWDATTRRQRVNLAREALAISADCADAYVLLAEEEGKTPDQALELYRQGMEAGERAIGPQAFEELKGAFWGCLETRPYMRAREGFATCLWAIGRRAEAVAHLQEMLELNPNDNQGLRCLLAVWLLELRRLDELGALLQQFEDDGSMEMVWAKAVRTFLAQGRGAAARQAFRAAVERNRHVVALLLAERPPQRPRGYVTMGGEDEAAALIHNLLPAVQGDDDAGQWFAEELSALVAELVQSQKPRPRERGPRLH